MINCELNGLMTALDFVRQHLSVCASLSSTDHAPKPLDIIYKGAVENNIQWVQKQCREHNLFTADERIARVWNIWSSVTPASLFMELKPLYEAMEDDLRKLYLYRYPREKAIMLLRIPGDWHTTMNEFPSIVKEIEHGVDCYAMEHNTACGFHMMRIAEVGMRALARERQVSFPDKPLEWAEWENIIDQIESKAKVGMPAARGPQKDAAKAFYTNAVAQLRAFKETRNRIMHVRVGFDELDALRAVTQVRDFMNGLSLKIGEKTRHPIRKWP